MSSPQRIDRQLEALPTPMEEMPNACFEKVKAAFHFALDCLIMVWYVLEHALYWLMTDKSEGDRVFQGQVLRETHNYAKFSELWSYVKLRRNPIPLPEGTDRYASKVGFTTNRTHIWTKPHSDGDCQGGVMAFYRKWFDTGDIEQVADYLEGGVPIQASVYQEMYISLFEDIHYPYLTEKIQEYIDNYPSTIVLDPDFSNAAVIFDGLQAYLRKGHNPEEGRMAQWVREWAIQHRRTRIGGKLYASLREAAHLYDGIDMGARDRTQATYPLARLQAEVLHYDAAPGDVLRTIGTLPPGAYNLTFPTYGSTGSKKKGHHTIAFIVQQDALSYFYEPNSYVAYGLREKVQPTIGRLLEGYTGFDYSYDLNGACPGLCGKISNFFREQANPPSTTPLTSGIDLLRITSL